MPENCRHDELKLISRWAIAVLGWDFGCVDVLRTPDKKFVVLEANSCPGLRDENTLVTYANWIKRLAIARRY
jgi:glutathione synthase/RimK-type ligase-like ATP-grasp enzyme